MERIVAWYYYKGYKSLFMNFRFLGLHNIDDECDTCDVWDRSSATHYKSSTAKSTFW